MIRKYQSHLKYYDNYNLITSKPINFVIKSKLLILVVSFIKLFTNTEDIRILGRTLKKKIYLFFKMSKPTPLSKVLFKYVVKITVMGDETFSLFNNLKILI